MDVSPKFLRFAAVCAAITALTTLAIHLMPHLWADVGTFEKQLDLRNRGLYLTRLWIVLIHCLLVVVSMYAVCLLSVRAQPGWAGLGFLAFFVFALTEIFRTSLALFALNRTWRTRYAANPDPEARGSIRAMIEAFSGVNDALFFIFIVAFFLGLLCYGVALATGKTSDRAMGFLSPDFGGAHFSQRSSTRFAASIRSRECSNGWATAFSPNRTRFHWRVAVEERFRPPPELLRRARSPGSSGDDTERLWRREVSLNKMIAIAGIPWDEELFRSCAGRAKRRP